MRKYILIAVLSFSAMGCFGQQQKQNDPLFNNWFTDQQKPIILKKTPPPPRDVPLDGGLIALITAGGAMGYKKYKDKNVE